MYQSAFYHVSIDYTIQEGKEAQQSRRAGYKRPSPVSDDVSEKTSTDLSWSWIRPKERDGCERNGRE